MLTRCDLSSPSTTSLRRAYAVLPLAERGMAPWVMLSPSLSGGLNSPPLQPERARFGGKTPVSC
jgi:hypothetical protein